MLLTVGQNRAFCSSLVRIYLIDSCWVMQQNKNFPCILAELSQPILQFYFYYWKIELSLLKFKLSTLIILNKF